MPLSDRSVYRAEAIEFQRRRLAGEIRLMPERRVLVLSGLMLAMFATLCCIAWIWSVPVSRTFACGYRAGELERVLVIASAIPAGAVLERVRLIAPFARELATDQLVASAGEADDTRCRVELSLRVHPLRQAVDRALRR